MTDGAKQLAYQKGVDAEMIAANYLRAHGYEIVQQRYKTNYGEIDLIVTKDQTLAAVEVKTRKTLPDALEAVTPRSRKRIEKALLHFVGQYTEYYQHDYRFDIVAITPPLCIHHLDNAWQPEA